MYGFVVLETGENIFFHLGSFKPKVLCLPPLPGEEVEVEVYPETQRSHRRAKSILRLVEPQPQVGIVKKFNPRRGFGFLSWEDKEIYFHKSDAQDLVIHVGNPVFFFLGMQEGKFRACYLSQARDQDVGGT